MSSPVDRLYASACHPGSHNSLHYLGNVGLRSEGGVVIMDFGDKAGIPEYLRNTSMRVSDFVNTFTTAWRYQAHGETARRGEWHHDFENEDPKQNIERLKHNYEAQTDLRELINRSDATVYKDEGFFMWLMVKICAIFSSDRAVVFSDHNDDLNHMKPETYKALADPLLKLETQYPWVDDVKMLPKGVRCIGVGQGNHARYVLPKAKILELAKAHDPYQIHLQAREAARLGYATFSR